MFVRGVQLNSIVEARLRAEFPSQKNKAGKGLPTQVASEKHKVLVIMQN